jgi:uncharacterized membrane protein
MSESPQDAAAPPGMSGRWRLVLLTSLALNLLLAGAAAGTMWSLKRSHAVGGGGGRGGAELALQGFIRSLPKDRAKELRQVIRQTGRPNMTPLIASVRQARRSAAEALASETFDKTKMEAAFSNIDAAEAATKAAARNVIIATAERMTPVERQSLADRWKSRRPQMFLDPPERPAGKRKKADEEKP